MSKYKHYCEISNINRVYMVQSHFVIIIRISLQQNVSCKEIRLLQFDIEQESAMKGNQLTPILH